jgi:hypothetical protein
MRYENTSNVFGPRLTHDFPHPKRNYQEIIPPITKRQSQNSFNSLQISRQSISPSLPSNQQQAERSSLSATSFHAMETASGQQPTSGRFLEKNDEEKKKDVKGANKKKIKKQLNKFIDSICFNFLALILTIFVLFGSDFEILFSDASSGLGFDIGRIITMTVFIVEVLISSFSKKNYVASFFFFLDIFSTLTIILDLNWIKNDLSVE